MKLIYTINKIVTAEVIADKPLKKKASAQPEKEEEPVVIKVSQNIPIDELIRDTNHRNPGKKLQSQDRCTRCAGKLIYEDSPTGKRPVKIAYESGGEVPLEQSKCHSIFIPKHYTITKIIRGIAHILTLGLFAGIGAIRGKMGSQTLTRSAQSVAGLLDQRLLNCGQNAKRKNT